MPSKRIILEGEADQLRGIIIPPGVKASNAGGVIENLEGGKPMENQDNRGYCPECHKKDLELLEHKHKLERAEEVAAAEKERITNLDVALKEAQEKEPQMIDPFEHYKTCKEPDCFVTKGFNALIANAQKPESLTPEQVKDAMKHHKIDEAPERIVLSGFGSKK